MQVLKNINLKINSNELVVLIGESGCGKTTTLKMINALIKPSSGSITVDGKNIQDINPIDLRRNMGYVIQQTGLFPHMTVKENIEIIAMLEKRPKEQIEKRTQELIEMVDMDKSYMNSYPSQLSGGQQQRIGVARAFSLDPDIILMDEPFSALDPVTKSQLQEELMELQENFKKTIVFVTHDMEEAIRIADKICILYKGEIVQYDTPENILKSPANEYVQDFIGADRIWSAPELIRIQDIMISDVVTGSPNATVRRALRRMYRKNVNSLIITNSKREVLGVLTAKNAAQMKDKEQIVKDVMLTEFEIASPEQSLLEILPTVSVDDIHSIPVIDENNILLGLITQSNLMLALSVPFVDDISLDFNGNEGVVTNND